MSIPIVAIGASAGDLDAISELLVALPPRADMAYVLVQHLDPAHESLLPELLAKKRRCRSVRSGTTWMWKRGHFYAIPPNATLTVARQRFA